MVSRRRLIQRFVRSFGIVEAAKRLEALLLFRCRVGGRLGGVLLQGFVHPLMLAVLLGLARNDALQPKTQLQPMNRQPA